MRRDIYQLRSSAHPKGFAVGMAHASRQMILALLVLLCLALVNGQVGKPKAILEITLVYSFMIVNYFRKKIST